LNDSRAHITPNIKDRWWKELTKLCLSAQAEYELGLAGKFLMQFPDAPEFPDAGAWVAQWWRVQ
jgi:hypothetical protein